VRAPSCAAFQALILSWSLRFLQRVTACTSSCGGTVRQVRLEEPQHLPGQGRTTVPEPRMWLVRAVRGGEEDATGAAQRLARRDALHQVADLLRPVAEHAVALVGKDAAPRRRAAVAARGCRSLSESVLWRRWLTPPPP
jgi:hypothetical protein